MNRVLNIYYGENIGGIEKNIEVLSKIFLKLSCKNFFLKFSKKKNKLDLNGKVFSLDESINTNIFNKGFRIFKRAYMIKNICKNNEIKTSISHGDGVNLCNILSKLLFRNKSKIIITLNNSLDDSGFVMKIFIKLLYNYADNIVFISGEMAHEFFDKFNIKTTKSKIIYNPIILKDISRLKDLKLENSDDKLFINGYKKFIHIGRLESVKNQKFLMEVFNGFLSLSKKSDYELLIVGDGQYKNELQELRRKLEFGDRIKIIGWRDNIYNILAKCDYFIFTSVNEGFGRVLIEATACGIPIITHDFKYGAKEILRSNEDYSVCESIEKSINGVLVPYANKQKFIEGLEAIVNLKSDRDQIIEGSKKYDISNISNMWKEII